MTLWGRYNFLHFTDEETKAEKQLRKLKLWWNMEFCDLMPSHLWVSEMDCPGRKLPVVLADGPALPTVPMRPRDKFQDPPKKGKNFTWTAQVSALRLWCKLCCFWRRKKSKPISATSQISGGDIVNWKKQWLWDLKDLGL